MAEGAMFAEGTIPPGAEVSPSETIFVDGAGSPREFEMDPGTCVYGSGDIPTCAPPIDPTAGPEYIITEEMRNTAPSLKARGIVGLILIGATIMLIAKPRLR